MWANFDQDTLFAGFVDFSPSPPPSPYTIVAEGKQSIAENLFQVDIVNQIFWSSIPVATSYKIYSDSGLQNCIYEGLDCTYIDHCIKKGVITSYYITYIDSVGTESSPTVISLP